MKLDVFSTVKADPRSAAGLSKDRTAGFFVGYGAKKGHSNEGRRGCEGSLKWTEE